MALIKALQLQTKIPGQEEYAVAHTLYCKRCSAHKRISMALRGRTDDTAELLLFKQQKLFKQQCKEYSRAKELWLRQQVEYKLGKKGLSLSVFDIAKILDVKLEVSDKDMTVLRRRAAFFENMSEDDIQIIKSLTQQRVNKSGIESVEPWLLEILEITKENSQEEKLSELEELNPLVQVVNSSGEVDPTVDLSEL